ncbi:hypothetical protein [Micromonospora haikouensis]|uniref:hypothetical protein n=1 Tax=Micromonospora haikouensis TaxID=686309 RepID=UPI003D73F394
MSSGTRKNTRPPGRPSKLTEETVTRLLAAIKAGATVRNAALYAGIGESTFHEWMAQAREESPRPEFLEFAEQIERARAELQVDVLNSVMETIRGGFVTKRVTRTGRDGEPEHEEQFAPPDGRLGLDLLSRIWPQDFAKRSAMEVSGPEGGPIELATAQRVQALAGRVAAALAAGASDEDVEDAEVVGEWGDGQ